MLQYYQNDYKAIYDYKNEQQIDVSQLIGQLSPAAINFQNQYIADNAFSLGEKDKLDTAKADNSYNRTHEKYHPTFRKFLHEFEFYDIFIVEPEEGNTIYSVYKELDYATSLTNGPYKSSGIAEAFKNALTLQEGEFYLTDFKPYIPSYNSSASFMSTPIYNNTLIGILIYQMPIEHVNNIMLQERNWLESGFGESGEIYLVGSDNTLRSDSRFFVEDKQGYLDLLKSKNIAAWKEIERKNTTISLQPVSTIAAKKALSGVSDTDTFKDYRGVDVFSAFAPINVGGLSWAIISEIDVEEAHRVAKNLSEQIVIQGLVILLISSVVSIAAAIAIANYLIRPLSELAEKVNKLSSG
ncbi:cache domain-containing protein [Pseudocolwellia sp. HL-MZ19]|uniref:cache domain-containing protein n=1 Tax=Pseudocolwellia sp. HL-MZ19 TaxID=3400846 RepID=UPI003CEB9F6C